MAFYEKVLQDLIEDEKRGKQYLYTANDRLILDEMFAEINRYAGTNFHYLAELKVFAIAGSGEIQAKYIWRLETHSTRSVLLAQMVADRIPNCDRLVLALYQDFRKSPVCTLDPERNPVAATCVRYDNAFRRLKPRRLKKELLELAADPRDACRLPFTLRMLASWKLPEMYDILLRYARSENITQEVLGFPADTEKRQRRIANVKRDLQFIAILGFKYYPTPEAEQILLEFAQSPDKDIVQAARKTLKALEKKKTTSVWKENER